MRATGAASVLHLCGDVKTLTAEDERHNVPVLRVHNALHKPVQRVLHRDRPSTSSNLRDKRHHRAWRKHRFLEAGPTIDRALR